MKTRQQKADELFARLRRGPDTGGLCIGPDPLTKEQAEAIAASNRGWAESYILVDLCHLIPELRKHLDSLGNVKDAK